MVLAASKPVPAVAARVAALLLKLIALFRPKVPVAFNPTVPVVPARTFKPVSVSARPRPQVALELAIWVAPPTSSASVVKLKVLSLRVAPAPAVTASLAADTPPLTPKTRWPLFRLTVLAPVTMSLSNTRSPPSLRPTSSVAALTWPIVALLSPVPRCRALAAVICRIVTLPLPPLAVTCWLRLMVSPVRITSPVLLLRLPAVMSRVLSSSSKLPLALKL
ncbi:hypothetical protein NB689_002171 [Xanthomonas sacchari]|nr:hypothetical protein [Xanthomonas sacchari]MCW0449755.1 hypothetical protein [Xanthomonas sacchari]